MGTRKPNPIGPVIAGLPITVGSGTAGAVTYSPAVPGGAVTGLKIDLSKLFGGADAINIAAQERDRELMNDGRQAVGLSVGIPKRQANKTQEPKDELDKLVDSLDALDI